VGCSGQSSTRLKFPERPTMGFESSKRNPLSYLTLSTGVTTSSWRRDWGAESVSTTLGRQSKVNVIFSGRCVRYWMSREGSEGLYKSWITPRCQRPWKIPSRHRIFGILSANNKKNPWPISRT
jgi:hypothetical protein